MEFFGIEVPAGNPTTCSPGYGMYLHVSQAALGDSKVKNSKGPERVVLKVSVDTKEEIVLGTLSEGKCDQMQLDLVFDRDFTISHNSKSSSIYICGYRTDAPEDDDDDEEEDEDEDEEEEEKGAPVPVAVPIVINGAVAGKPSKSAKAEEAAKALAKVTDKAANTVANAIAKAVEKTNSKKPGVEAEDSDEEDESDDDEGMGHPFLSDLASESDDEFDAGDDSDEDMDEDDDEDEEEDDEDESDESDDEELNTPEVKTGKKRSGAESVKSSEKKAKTDASPKPEQVSLNGKKGKKAAQGTPIGKEAEPKTPTDKGLKPAKAPKGTPTAPPSTPVSAKKVGDHKCTSCDRSFTTESALSQHSAAKHK